MIRCRQCNSELVDQARFCNICGLPQNPIKPEQANSNLNGPKAPDTKNTNHCINCATALPKGARFCAVCGATQTSKNAAIRPRTVIRPPVFPSQPTSNDIKPSAAIQQVQTSKELSTPAQTPGPIRPVTPNSSMSPVILSQPDSNGQAISSSTPAQVARTSEYPHSSPPTKGPSHVTKQFKQRSSPAFIQSDMDSQDKQQISQVATQHIPGYSQPKVNGKGVQSRPHEQIAGAQKTPVEPAWQKSSTHDLDTLLMRSTTPIVDEKNGDTDSPTIDLLNPASFLATSKAAEQWRTSWRDRQYAEAGPAENVSRGQASVPMPLTSMYQSLARMRAIQKNENKHQGKRPLNFGTWITIFLLLCLIVGLGAFIIVSYLPNTPFGVTSETPPTNNLQPTLALVGTTSQTIEIGQSIQLHGEHFGADQTINFLRDTATPVVDTRGSTIFTHTDSQGAFNVTIPTDFNWTVGSHSIEALDKSSNQNAFQTIQIMPAGNATSTSTQLSISMQGKPASLLTFKAVIGQGNSDPQQIIITNTSGSPLQWTATAYTNNNLNWLIINDNNNYGQLAISQPHNILISVNTTGLTSTDSKHPYLGHIIFTINNTQLLTLPVQLQIADATPEMVFSPDPIVAHIGPGNTCQTGVTLTLINLGTATISWAVNPDDKDKIKFTSNGQLLESGTLLPSGSQLPSGQPGDTVVLSLQCNSVQAGQQYHVSVYANQLSWSESVIIMQ
jgi:hypothetical protein